MDLRGNLEVGGPEGIPEAETHDRPMINLGGDEYLLGSTSVGQETYVEYVRGGF